MVKSKTKRSKAASKPSTLEMDSLFIFKLVLFLILGSQWLYIIDSTSTSQIPVPIGAIIGVAFAVHEHFKIDRKIEYAIMLLAMFVGFWLPMGININH